ncbi:hypothetical protein [Algoriphagus confluentis]|uniref:Uncharacterized protein n=1 Tax=Algoriphagus confluentis TaxID=1697556 RepID=A0ABQ6PRZ0_9BACT|nr:hypothetical protein Aconfl_33440 [Algoriphagus confluentis]
MNIKPKQSLPINLAVSFSVILFAVVVPILELNETHVWNPDWTPHAKIHEVWQLITNCGIGVLCLYLAWLKGESRLSSILCLLVMGGFLLAFILKEGYGGSMRYLDGSEKTVFGINIGVFGYGLATLGILISIGWDELSKRQKTTSL